MAAGAATADKQESGQKRKAVVAELEAGKQESGEKTVGWNIVAAELEAVRVKESFHYQLKC